MQSNAMSERTSPASQWDDCPPGTLNQFSVIARAQQTRKQLKFVALATAACLLVSASLAVALMRSVGGASGRPSTAIACVDVKRNIDGYFSQALASDLRGNIDNHLSYCQPCRALYEARAEELGVELLVTGKPSVWEPIAWSPYRPAVRAERPPLTSIVAMLR